MLSTRHTMKWLLSLCGGSDGRLGEPGWHPGEHICGVRTETYVPLPYNECPSLAQNLYKKRHDTVARAVH